MHSIVVDEYTQYPLQFTDEYGTIVPIPPSNVGREVVVGDTVFTVVWDGGKPDPLKDGHTKGRLLPIRGPRYIDSLTALGRLYGKPEKADEKEVTAIEPA